MKGLLARKLGMTQLFNADGTTSAVTVLEAGPCRVLGLRTTEKDGYSAARIAFEAVHESRLTKPEHGEFKKANVEPHRHIVEIRNYDGVEPARSSKPRSSPPGSSSTSRRRRKAKASRDSSRDTSSAAAPSRTVR